MWGIFTSAFLLGCWGLPDVQQVGKSAGAGLFWVLKRVPGETGLPNSPWAEGGGVLFLALAFALGGGILSLGFQGRTCAPRRRNGLPDAVRPPG